MIFPLLFCLFVQDFKAIVLPVNFQNEDNPKTHIAGIRQLSTDGFNIYIVPTKSPSVIILNNEGEFLSSINATGEGPGMIGYHAPSSIYPVTKKSFWIHHNNQKKLSYFENGKFVKQIRIRSNQFTTDGQATYRFVGDSDKIIIPAHPGSGKLAGAYDYGGNAIGTVGEIFKIGSAFYKVNPALNNTIWSKDENHWYCVFMYRPYVRKFDSDLQLVDQYRVNLKENEEKERLFVEKKRDPYFTFPIPHFTDIQVYGDHIYLLSSGNLVQIDKSTGEVKERARFFNELEGWSAYGKRLNFESFVILDDGTIYLSNSMFLGEQDMWKVSLPFVSPTSAKP